MARRWCNQVGPSPQPSPGWGERASWPQTENNSTPVFHKHYGGEAFSVSSSFLGEGEGRGCTHRPVTRVLLLRASRFALVADSGAWHKCLSARRLYGSRIRYIAPEWRSAQRARSRWRGGWNISELLRPRRAF